MSEHRAPPAATCCQNIFVFQSAISIANRCALPNTPHQHSNSNRFLFSSSRLQRPYRNPNRNAGNTDPQTSTFPFRNLPAVPALTSTVTGGAHNIPSPVSDREIDSLLFLTAGTVRETRPCKCLEVIIFSCTDFFNPRN